MLPGAGAQAARVRQNLPKAALEIPGYWRPGPAGDLCTTSDQVKCRSLVTLKKILFILCTGLSFIFQVITSFLAFMPQLGLSVDEDVRVLVVWVRPCCRWDPAVSSSPPGFPTVQTAIPGGFVPVSFCSEKTLGLKAKCYILPKAVLPLSSAQVKNVP